MVPTSAVPVLDTLVTRLSITFDADIGPLFLVPPFPSRLFRFLPAKLLAMQLNAGSVAAYQPRRSIADHMHQPIWATCCNQDTLIGRRRVDGIPDEGCHVWPAGLDRVLAGIRYGHGSTTIAFAG